MDAEWGIGLILSLTFLGLWALCRRVEGSWISPGAMLSAIWFTMTFLPLLVVYYYPLYLEAYFFVLAFVVAGLVGTGLAGRLLSGVRAAPRRPFAWRPDTLRLMEGAHVLSLLLGSASPVVLYKVAVAKYGVTGIFELAGKISGDRYNGEFDQPFIVTLLNMSLSLAAIIGGFLLASAPRRDLKSLRFVLWMVPLQVSTTIQTTKASLMFTLVFFCAGLIAGIGLRGGEGKVRIGRLFVLIFGLSAFAFLFTLVNSFIRYGLTDLERLSELVGASAGTSFGHMAVLGNWLNEGGLQRTECAVGSYSFAGLAQYVGFGDRKQGLFEISVFFSNGYFSNIYTGFRSLIEDFTLPGGLAFMACFGFLGGAGWIFLCRGGLAASGLVVSFLSYAIISPITSVFTYNMNFGALTLFSALITLLALRERLVHV